MWNKVLLVDTGEEMRMWTGSEHANILATMRLQRQWMLCRVRVIIVGHVFLLQVESFAVFVDVLVEARAVAVAESCVRETVQALHAVVDAQDVVAATLSEYEN